MPRARVAIATAVKPGLAASVRSVYRSMGLGPRGWGLGGEEKRIGHRENPFDGADQCLPDTLHRALLECCGEIRYRALALFRCHRERLRYRGANAVRDVAWQLRNACDTGERRMPGEHFVRHARETVHIGAAVNRQLTERLLRAHVAGRSATDLRGSPTLVLTDGPRDAKVHEVHVSAVEQNVLGLHIAMQDPLTVGMPERGGR